MRTNRHELRLLARELVTPERYGRPALEGALAPDERVLPIDEQPTIEFDSAEVARLCEIERQREIIDRELTGDVEAEKARILENRLPEFGVPFGQVPYYGD